jgi:two-component system nitrate/nitrite response regulator NarL
MAAATLPETSSAPATSGADAPAPAADQPLKVVIADDHPLFRRGLARAIHRHSRFELVGEAADGREALALIDALEPDVAVLDHRMPHLSGVEVCAQLGLRAESTRTRVLLLSAFEDPDIVASAVAGGAAGYVGKSAAQGDICLAIERIGRGGIAYTAATSAGLDLALSRRGQPAPPRASSSSAIR